jgi:hypothetical protein
MMLSLNDFDSRSDVRAFQQLLESIDRMVCAAGFEKSMAWFRKAYKTQDTVSNMYQPLERKSKDKVTGEEDGRWPPSVKLALPDGPDGKPKYVCYNMSQQEIDIDSIDTRHANVTAIVCLQSIWIAGNMFGVSFKAMQLLVEPKRTMAACAFRNVACKPLLSAGAGSVQAVTAALESADLVESSDDDEEDVDVGDV